MTQRAGTSSAGLGPARIVPHSRCRSSRSPARSSSISWRGRRDGKEKPTQPRGEFLRFWGGKGGLGSHALRLRLSGQCGFITSFDMDLIANIALMGNRKGVLEKKEREGKPTDSLDKSGQALAAELECFLAYGFSVFSILFFFFFLSFLSLSPCTLAHRPALSFNLQGGCCGAAPAPPPPRPEGSLLLSGLSSPIAF